MTAHTTGPLARGRQVPRLKGLGLSGETIDSRRWYLRRQLVVLFTHQWPCHGCATYLAQLAACHPAVTAARGQLVAVVALGPVLAVGELARLGDEVAVMLDEDEALHARCGLVEAGGQLRAALVVTDDVGTIYASWETGAGHAFPTPDEVVSWVEYVSYQCTECGADSPVVFDS